MATKTKKSSGPFDHERAPTREQFFATAQRLIEERIKLAVPLAEAHVATSLGITTIHVRVSCGGKTSLGFDVDFDLRPDADDNHKDQRWKDLRERRYFVQASIGNGATHRTVSEALAHVSLLRQLVEFASIIEHRYDRVLLYEPEGEAP